MTEGIATTGVPSLQELEHSPGYPRSRDFERGPIAVIECVQEIPCDPCETACHKGAIVVGEPITRLPRFDASQCSGCGLCIASCPGQAIFVVHLHYSRDESLVSFPYEYYPLPEEGSTLGAINRAGETVCLGRVFRVRTSNALDRTAVVTIRVPRAFAHEVRGIERIRP